MRKWSNFSNTKRRESHAIGMQAEQRAKAYLQAQGLRFITQNYRCKAGEIDLIMQDNEHLVFVEVKYRSRTQFGAALEYFTPQKRRKVETTIYHYLQKVGMNAHLANYRLDLVAIDGENYQWVKAI